MRSNLGPVMRHSSDGKVTAGLAESNGSLPPGDDLKVTCGLTVCTPVSAQDTTISNEYGRTLLFLLMSRLEHLPIVTSLRAAKTNNQNWLEFYHAIALAQCDVAMVILFACPYVRLSNACFVTKRKNLL